MVRFHMKIDSLADLDGFYAVFMTGLSGEGYTVLVFSDGKIVGVDPLGVTFDGSLEKVDGGFAGAVTVDAPPGGELIQGIKTGDRGLEYVVQLELPSDFLERDYVEIATPLGPVNARFKKMRDLGALMK